MTTVGCICKNASSPTLLPLRVHLDFFPFCLIGLYRKTQQYKQISEIQFVKEELKITNYRPLVRLNCWSVANNYFYIPNNMRKSIDHICVSTVCCSIRLFKEFGLFLFKGFWNMHVPGKLKNNIPPLLDKNVSRHKVIKNWMMIGNWWHTNI